MLVHEKLHQAIGILREYNVDCWLTFTRESQLNGDPILPFLVNGELTWHSALIVTSSGRTHAIVGQFDRQGVVDLGAYGQVDGYVKSFKEPFLAVIRQLNPRSIAVNYSTGSEICDGLTHGMYLLLEATLAEIGFQDRLVSAEKIVSALRQRKTPSEIDTMKEAIKRTEEIFRKVTGFIRPGRTEKEIAAFMRGEVEKGRVGFAWEQSTCPAVFTGPDTAAAHYAPTDRKVEQGHLLNIDFGVRVNEYCSDFQRTFYVRNNDESVAPPDVQKGFDTIVRSIELSQQALKPGVLGVDIDRIARDTIVAGGYEEFPHALGHQVGRFSHDGTALLGPAWEKYADKPFEKIEQGMVFTLEPRLTVARHGIATIEEMVLVTENGSEYLSTPQKELLLV